VGRLALTKLRHLSRKTLFLTRSAGMAITKKLRVVFYALATLELLVLSALYAWGRTGLH
jgi:hypothetical protein